MAPLPVRGPVDLNAAGKVRALAPTQPVEVPKQAILPLRKARPDSQLGEVTETGWEVADAAYDQHEVGLRRKDRWNGFQGQRAAHAALLAALRGGPAPFQSPESHLGEPALNYFMRFSAALGEYYRAHGERVGITRYAYNPGEDSPRARGGAGGFRRTFALE